LAMSVERARVVGRIQISQGQNLQAAGSVQNAGPTVKDENESRTHHESPGGIFQRTCSHLIHRWKAALSRRSP
jgi:hypothetical protein